VRNGASPATIAALTSARSGPTSTAERTAKELPHREKYLLLVVGFLRGLLDLHLELVDEVDREFESARTPSASGGD
jgi:hypothetical protein